MGDFTARWRVAGVEWATMRLDWTPEVVRCGDLEIPPIPASVSPEDIFTLRGILANAEAVLRDWVDYECTPTGEIYDRKPRGED